MTRLLTYVRSVLGYCRRSYFGFLETVSARCHCASRALLPASCEDLCLHLAVQVTKEVVSPFDYREPGFSHLCCVDQAPLLAVDIYVSPLVSCEAGVVQGRQFPVQ